MKKLLTAMLSFLLSLSLTVTAFAETGLDGALSTGDKAPVAPLILILIAAVVLGVVAFLMGKKKK